MTTEIKKKKLPQFECLKGDKYRLTKLLAEGGQGKVYVTDFPQRLIKGFTNKDEAVRQKWRKHIDWLTRQDIFDLKLARPLTLLKEPTAGYVMELMDGLIPLKDLLDSFIEAEDESTENYIVQGGLRRRIRILIQLARTLNQLHSRGMLYGDISPDNIFVSDDSEYAETWLIDCDNISFESHSELMLHTPDYGAPEIVRGEGMLSSLTDCWSFAIIAYQLLTHNHPFKGDLVNDGEPEMEDAALRGEHPWINDSNDADNECSNNIPLQLMEYCELPSLFQRCFEDGKLRPADRPSMAEWLEALSEVDERLYHCPKCDAHSIFPKNIQSDDLCCSFCESEIDDNLVVFEEFIFIPDTEINNNDPLLQEQWLKTGRQVYFQTGNEFELKRLMPTFCYDQRSSDHLTIAYTELGLELSPKEKLHLQRGSKTLKPFEKKIRLKNDTRNPSADPFRIHLGDLDKTHIIWQFRW